MSRDMKFVFRVNSLLKGNVTCDNKINAAFTTTLTDAQRRHLFLEAELCAVKAGCLELEKQLQLLKQVRLGRFLSRSRAGLPDFSLFKIPKREEIYQIATKLPNGHNIY
jgi:hypothetical protein